MASQQSIGRKEALMGLLRGQSQAAQAAFFPAPTAGINRTSSIGELQPNEAYLLTNLISGSSGISVRPGYVNHVTLIGNSPSTEVRTVAPFNDVSRDQQTPRDRMFAFTDQGIYDVTNAGSNPVLMPIYDGVGSGTVLSTGWLVKGGDAGWVSHINFTNAIAQGGKHYLIACDIINGYHIYDPDGGGPGIGRWYKVKEGNSGTTIEGIDPTKFSHVCTWKGRLIFSETSSSRAWYLTPGAITGTGASKPIAVDMGSRFSRGGFLKGCFAWTYDGGAGIDDFLVVISSAGDLVVWQGISPADENFQMKGIWYVGDTPRGRRICSDAGGDLLILSSFGLVPISSLVQGAREGDTRFLTYKVQSLVRNLFRRSYNDWGWNLCSLPSLGGYLVLSPRIVTADAYFSLYVSLTQQAWSELFNVPALDACQFRGVEYIATYDGRICAISGNVDTTQNSPGVFTDDPIDWRMITSFQPYGSPANWKGVQLIRPVFVAEQLPTYSISARYDFDITLPNATDPPPLVNVARWDLALWDNAYWGGQFITEQPTIGAEGLGRWVALAMSGRSSKPTAIVGFNVIYKTGGML